MPIDCVPLAACVHCQTVVVADPEMLLHPLQEERGTIRRALGAYWFQQARTRFDGRIHSCRGRARRVPTRETWI